MSTFLEKFALEKGSKKYLCPQCGKKRFVVYINKETGQPENEHAFGRCDREAECGYHVKPDAKVKEKEAYVVTTIYPDSEILKSLTSYSSNLHSFLVGKGIPIAHLHNCGVLESKGLTAYVFRNSSGKFCNIKYFKYKADGHRDHSFDSFSLKQPEQRNKYVEEKYTMPLFMEDKLDPDKKKIVCVVESEKTAAIASFFYPQFDWVACGSANGLSDGSEGTANKIAPLKGRIVYWLCDADKASRGKMIFDEKSKSEVWQWCSSVRNGIKHIDNFCVVDLWPTREDGYDIGDALIDGHKPEINPTWSKKMLDKRSESYIPPDINSMLYEFRNGKEVGDDARVSQIKEIFSWKRGFVNCWTGWPNDGKTTFFMHMAITKSAIDNWKWCIWPPEMINSYKDNVSKKIKISGNDIYDELIFMYTGKNPYKHFEQKYHIKQMSEAEYVEAYEWVRKHFFVVLPKDRRYKSIMDNFLYISETFGADGFLADPFKSFKHDEQGRTDLYMDDVFIDFKEFSTATHSSVNFIAHPKSQDDVKNKDGSYKVCNQFMLAGGASWNNNMDGIYSTYRPNRHNDPTDPKVHFFNLKQRKQELTGRVGKYDKIKFDFLKHRYYFDGTCPIDGATDPSHGLESNTVKPFNKPAQRTKNMPDIPFQDHLIKDWGIGGDEDAPF